MLCVRYKLTLNDDAAFLDDVDDAEASHFDRNR